MPAHNASIVPEQKLAELWALFLEHDNQKKGILVNTKTSLSFRTSCFIFCMTLNQPIEVFLSDIIKATKNPLTTSMLGLIGESAPYRTLYCNSD
jgi:hypothetical protein